MRIYKGGVYATLKGMNKELTNDKLGQMIAEGFEGVDKRFEAMDKRMDKRFEGIDNKLEQVDTRLEHIDARLDLLTKDVTTIKEHIVYRYEFNDLMARVKYMEVKMGIESGK